ncbi:TonB-dependent receptor [Flavobacterium sp. Sd200]|uniref:TonB-dependent receptor n=1 Tax=Flavobacterium sp. Sd200 TaxID=2692211 RepID=UPI00136A7D15|nr:TonB-dependent receptor [Flavobacterium sp. Sd200]MXN90869.1 TonB-dependent receptor [Flavobacterium sp. Sd200]
MKNFTRYFFTAFVMLFSVVMMAQETIKGNVTDTQNLPLPGATVMVKGTKDIATTGIDGTFTLSTSATSGSVIISFLGHNQKTVAFTITPGTPLTLEPIMLTEDSEELDAVVIVGKGVIDMAQDRRTPVAVSNISRREIQEKSGNQEFPEVMKNTPGIYVASQAGGYGDSKMFVRGFDQTNTAFMLNGQPINGMEDGNMYWSNWSGMTDVANQVQVQRGLGSSKLAISSVGGTVNIVTKATDLRKGGFAQSMIGNDNYSRTTVGYNTGLMESGFGASAMLTKWSGDGYNRGTYGEGYNYFLSFGYKANDKHLFNFLVFGAPQQHDQNYTKSIANYLRYGRKYNNNYGFLDGDYISERVNYYHKPVANFNWDFTISDKMNLSTVAYASWGRGGGTGNYGSSANKKYTSDGHIDFGTIRTNNRALTDGIGTVANSYLIRNSVNNHSWYGVVSNFNHEISQNLSYNAGVDLRTYKGTHYREVSNFMGLNGFFVDDNVQYPDYTVTEQFSANPWSSFTNKPANTQKIDYDYDERISYLGVFGQVEYKTDEFSAFVQGAISNQSHVRWDRQQYSKEQEKSDKVNNTGYNIKGGASYTFAEQHTLFANAGFYSRQPYHDNIYLNFGNEVNNFTENEKITGLEAGYRFRSNYVDINLDGYMTRWKDRVTTNAMYNVLNTITGNEEQLFSNNSGVHQLHTGVELEVTAHPTSQLDIKGFASIGNWKYDDNVYTRVFDESRNIIPNSVYKTTATSTSFIQNETINEVKGRKVGGAAQTVFGLGASYKIVKGLSVDADWRMYDKLYSSTVTKDIVEIPSYDLVDAGLTYRLNFTNTSLVFRANVNNVFDEVYLSEITSSNVVTPTSVNYRGVNVTNNVFFGNGRTWNFSMRYNF